MILLLLEDLEEIKKHYPNITNAMFNRLIALDPTYRADSNHLGKYGKWILGLYSKDNELNIGHISDVLTRFNDTRHRLKQRDIGRFKSLEELDEYINNPDNYTELTQSQLQQYSKRRVHRLDIERDLSADKVYEDKDWVVYKPSSYENSCKLGRDTLWCTATTSNRHYYDKYTQTGPLYITINKHNPKEKYQLHIDSKSFMDRDDKALTLIDAFGVDTPIINSFYKPLLESSVTSPKDRILIMLKLMGDETSVNNYLEYNNSLSDDIPYNYLHNIFCDLGEYNFLAIGLIAKYYLEKEQGSEWCVSAQEFAKVVEKMNVLHGILNPSHHKHDSFPLPTEWLTRVSLTHDKDELLPYVQHSKLFNGDIKGLKWSDIDTNNRALLQKLGVNSRNIRDIITNKTTKTKPDKDISDAVYNALNHAYKAGVHDNVLDLWIEAFENALAFVLPGGIEYVGFDGSKYCFRLESASELVKFCKGLRVNAIEGLGSWICDWVVLVAMGNNTSELLKPFVSSNKMFIYLLSEFFIHDRSFMDIFVDEFVEGITNKTDPEIFNSVLTNSLLDILSGHNPSEAIIEK